MAFSIGIARRGKASSWRSAFAAVVLGVIFGLLFGASSLKADQTGSQLQAASPIMPMMVEQLEDGRIDGYSVAVARAIVGEIGGELAVEIVPFKRSLRMLQDGSANFALAILKTPEREAYVDYAAHPHAENFVVFYAHSSNLFTWNGLFGSLPDTPICIVRGWSLGKRFDTFAAHAQIVEAPSIEAGVRMVDSGRCKLFASSQRITDPIIAGLADKVSVEALSPPISSVRPFFGFAKGWNPAFQSRFNAVLLEMVHDGRLAELAKIYGVTAPRSSGPETIKLESAGAD